MGKRPADVAESENLCMCGNFKRENREILLVSLPPGGDETAVGNGRRTFQTVRSTCTPAGSQMSP